MRQIGESGLDKQSGTQNVDSVALVEVARVDITKWNVGRNAGIVDDDVDLEFARFRMRKVVLCGGDDVFGARGLTDICLDGYSADAVGGGKGGCKGRGFLGGGGGCVIYNEGGAFGGKILRNGRSDT